MITPKKITFFVGLVLLILFLISLCFPESEQKIAENTILKFPSVKDIFQPKKVEYADISGLIKASNAIEDTADIVLESIDIINTEPTTSKVDTIRASEKYLLDNYRKIDYPNNDIRLLYSFFRQLNKAKYAKQPVRIMHYGDSQIEGDRITSYIRDKLQQKFGGSGPGMLPVVQPYGQFSMKQEVSSNWKRYTLFGQMDHNIYHKRYGALASFCRFTPVNNKKNAYEAWLSAEKGIMSYETARNYSCFKIFYGYNKKPFVIEVFEDKTMLDADFIPVANDLHVKKWKFNKTPKNLTVKFKGEDSPDFYGLSFESENGVIVDNIPMRGSSGLVFTKIDKDLLKKMYNELSVELIILQYGGNAVPFIKDPERYGDLFYKQLIRLQSLVPGIPVLVIGVADMSVKEKNYYKTYPVLPEVRDALKKASFEAGCAYWDMFEAMGGENSMPSWVFAQPALASKDFVHFNHRGARLIAAMFYKALMHDFEIYLNEQQNTGFARIN